jgi:hypothetical protein
MLPGWQDIVRFFSEQWRVISGARASFFGGLLLIGLIIGAIQWGALSWRYSAQLDNKDSIIATKDATISQQSTFLEEYRSKLKGASPDETVKNINELELEVQRLKTLDRARTEREWPALKEDEVSRWAGKLSPIIKVSSRSFLKMNIRRCFVSRSIAYSKKRAGRILRL